MERFIVGLAAALGAVAERSYVDFGYSNLSRSGTRARVVEFAVDRGARLVRVAVPDDISIDNQTVSASYSYTGPRLGLVVGF